ncbi:unnamed protein product, partial [Staurois parvus]
ASVVRQAGSISIGQVGTGGASGEWSGSQARVRSRRMVRQARDQSRVSRESDRDRNRNRKQGPGETQHQGRVCRSECPLNTPV